MISSRTYKESLYFLSEQAPEIEMSPSNFIAWAEPICDFLSFLYPSKDYDTITEDLYSATKSTQGFDDEEEL